MAWKCFPWAYLKRTKYTVFTTSKKKKKKEYRKYKPKALQMTTRKKRTVHKA